MQYTGIIELVASEIWDSKKIFLNFNFYYRMDRSIEDFNKALMLDS